MKKLILMAVLLVLSACYNDNGNMSIEEESAVYHWDNLYKVTDTSSYSYASPNYTLEDFISLAQVAATPNTVCGVLWKTTSVSSGVCRVTSIDGQWPSECISITDGSVSCGMIQSVPFFALSALGAPRDFTIEETSLIDEIQRQTYCTAPRLDGSASPCI